MKKTLLFLSALLCTWVTNAQLKPKTIIPTGNYIGVKYLDISPDEKYMITLCGSEVNLWEIASGTPITTFQSKESNMDVTRFSPDGKHVITGAISPSGIGTVLELWDLETQKLVRDFRAEDGYGSSFCFSPDSKLIACSGANGKVFIYDLQTGTLKSSFKGKGSAKTIQFFPDGNHMLMSGIGGGYVFDIKSGNMVTELDVEQTSSGEDIAISSDGKWILLAAGEDIVLFDAKTFDQSRVFKGHLENVRSVNFSPDLQSFVSTSYDGTVKVWDLRSGEQKVSMSSGIKVGEVRAEINKFYDGVSGITEYAKYSPDGKRIYVGVGDGSIQVFNSLTGARERTFKSPVVSFDHLFYDDKAKNLYTRLRKSNQAKSFNILSGKIESVGVRDDLRWDKLKVTTGTTDMMVSYYKNSVYFYENQKFAGKLFFIGEKDWVFFRDEFYDGSPVGISTCFKLNGLTTTKLNSKSDPQYKPGLLKQIFKL
ncbi:WD40 repeat domain-containing protein [Pedobacter aquatilis]|uniref:WD40 repeat domain-containing protein n=1 Tax=Pedobacter aquatilis TaxID=351343 RepID=UPI00292ED399|nr:WD40 repeat domain-containing protein [Pedobacter aquatilis]